MKGKILYVEDNGDIAEVVRLLLQKEGYEVEIAYTGSQGLRMFKEKSYDLALLDVMLPDMSGIELFEKLGDEDRKRCMFLTILTIPSKQMSELKKKGAHGSMKKPFKNDELIKEVNELFKYLKKKK